MLKKILAVLAMLYAAASFAAVDINKATAAELDAVKGIGPAMSQRIIDERKKGDFKSWEDVITRVKGVGENNAAKFSAEGLTVKGESYKKAAEAKKEDKKAAKSAKMDDKAAAKDEKKEAKSETKSGKMETKSEKKEEKKEEKAAAAAKPAEAAKPAASAKPAEAAKK